MTETTFADPDDGRRCVCANCAWDGPANQTRPIEDLWDSHLEARWRAEQDREAVVIGPDDADMILEKELPLPPSVLWGVVTDEDLSAILGRRLPLAEACRGLVTAAYAAGGRDNITVVLIAAPG